jgi:hypothetical protein
LGFNRHKPGNKAYLSNKEFWIHATNSCLILGVDHAYEPLAGSSKHGWEKTLKLPRIEQASTWQIHFNVVRIRVSALLKDLGGCAFGLEATKRFSIGVKNPEFRLFRGAPQRYQTSIATHRDDGHPVVSERRWGGIPS